MKVKRNRGDLLRVTVHTGESEKKQNGFVWRYSAHTSESVKKHRADLLSVTVHTGESEKKQYGFA